MSSGSEQNKKSRQFFRHDETDCNLVSDLNMASAIEPESGDGIMTTLDVADDPPADVVAADPKVETHDALLTDLDMAPDCEAESDSEDIARAAVWSKKVTEPESEWSKKVTDETTKPLSKKVTRRFRCSDSIDTEIIKRIQQFKVCPEAPLGTPLVGDFQPSISHPLKPTNDNALPVWELTKGRVKLAASTWALQVCDRCPVSWTLNLTPERIDEAQRDPRGFTESLKRDLDRAFKRELGSVPLYWFSIDVSSTERLHLHGAIAADHQELEANERALRHVGGHGPKPEEEDYMVHLNPQRCDEGWAIYSIRNAAKVRRLIKGRTFSITGRLRSEGKWFYDEVRRLHREGSVK
jgi:hypothetical protein